MSEFKLRFSVETVSLLYPLGSNFRRLMMDVAFEVIEDLITSCLQLVGWPSSSLTRGSHLRASHGSVCDRDQNAIKRSRQPWSGNQAIKVTQERQSKDQDEFRATECRINGYTERTNTMCLMLAGVLQSRIHRLHAQVYLKSQSENETELHVNNRENQ